MCEAISLGTLFGYGAASSAAAGAASGAAAAGAGAAAAGTAAAGAGAAAAAGAGAAAGTAAAGTAAASSAAGLSGLQIAGLVSSLVGAGVTGLSQYQAGKSQEEIGKQNAKITAQRAERANAIGGIEQLKQIQRTRQLLAAQRTSMAANGLDLGSGSALDILGETAGMGAADTETIRQNMLSEAWGYGLEQQNLRTNARLAARAGRMGAAGTLLTGGAQAAGRFY